MVQHKKMAKDVDLLELASLTKNFSGAELEGLVRAAQSCALNRLVDKLPFVAQKRPYPVQVKADAKVEVDLEAAEELLVTRADFLHALKHDVKPALGSAEDLLQVLIETSRSLPSKYQHRASYPVELWIGVQRLVQSWPTGSFFYSKQLHSLVLVWSPF